MTMRRIAELSSATLALLALSSCAGVPAPNGGVQLEVVGSAIDAPVRPFPDFYKLPQGPGESTDGGRVAQRWSMLGREDRAAASASSGTEYKPRACAAEPGSPAGWDEVIDAIVARAAGHRVVIVNESHMVTRHRETTRRLLVKLRPLGFRVLAAETFTQGYGGAAPVEALPAVPWPQMSDGTYSEEPAFGRLVRDAKALGYRLAPYEEIYDPSTSASDDRFASVVRRETAQAQHLAAILQAMPADERLIVHAGYGHGSEVAFDFDGRDIEWMGARLKALTGIDPLTITQTVCRSAGGLPFLAMAPEGLRPGQFDMFISHPVDVFERGRPTWRREAGDVPTPIPGALKPVAGPVVMEAFAWGEPFDAVPVDRVYVEPGEDVPLLLPPGRYRLRAVRPAMP